MFLEYAGGPASVYGINYKNSVSANPFVTSGSQEYPDTFYNLYKLAFYSSGVGDNLLYTIPHELSKVSTFQLKFPELATVEDQKEYRAYIVIYIFKLMLATKETSIKQINTHLHVLTGILHDFFYRDESQMVFFKNNKYLHIF
jgi:hypothetical protein